ncbi:MAG: hypothetical protein HYU66_10345, partial [Armatimonadetes bacterium]|nr:hypothetical protein [Armatimonadota bacterium]
MTVRIDTLVAEPGEARVGTPLRFVGRSLEMGDAELARKPLEYAALVETTATLLALAARVLPALVPGSAGRLDREALVPLLSRALDGVVLDETWEQGLRERLAVQIAGRRRGLRGLRPETEEDRREQLAQLQQALVDTRLATLQEPNLAAALVEMQTDGFVAVPHGQPDALCLPGAEQAGPGPFHAAALREGILAHLDEVQRWNLPAPDAARFAALAREHSRLLDADSPAENSMLSAEVARRLEAALESVNHLPDTRHEQLLAILLRHFRAPQAASGLLDVFPAAERLLPAVLEPANVATVLEEMADEGALQQCGAWYLDPALAREAAAAPERLAALRADLGVDLAPGQTLPEPPPVTPPADAPP